MAGLSRKTVTVLFSDVVDSTPLGESVDPEAVRAVLGRYFDEMRVVIERHGGTVEKYIGDEIMAVFGIPQVHEDDALRAVRAATEMREVLGRLNATQPYELRARTALNTGEVVTGDRHTLVTGDAVNTAARLRSVTSPGEIIVGAATYDLVRDAVLAEPLEPFELKGKSAPVRAWRVTAVIPDAPGRARRLDSKLVGREPERALLRQAYARVIGTRSCHLFTILGAAGVGKSRLVNSVIADVQPEALPLVGRCLAYGEGITYWPLRDVIHGVGDLEAHVEAADAETIRGAVGLSDALAVPEDAHRAVRRLVEALARERPLVLGFDELHWAQPTFLDLVDHLADTIRDAPVLLVCLARPELLEERPLWAGGKLNATTILLEPLDAYEADSLVDNLGGDELPAALRRTITEVSEGNPLFIEEMVAMALEDPDATSVPPTIQALLAARVERLAPDERRVLAAASVAGRFFSRAAVAELVGGDVDGHLERLGRKELIRPEPVPFTAADGYRFRHILIRDAAYDALAKSERAAMHERLADWLGETSDGRRELDELIGYHLERAHVLRRELGEESTQTVALATRAAQLLGAAGRRAYAREDMPAAVNLLDRATALGREQDLEMLRELAGALWLTGEGRRSNALLDEVIDAAVVAGDRRVEWSARLQCTAQRNLDGAVDASEVDAVARRAIAVFDELGDEFGLAQARRRLALVARRRGRHAEALDLAEKALAHVRRAGSRQEEGRIVDGLCISLVAGPTPVPEAAARCRDLLAHSSGSSMLEAAVQVALAALEAMAGDAAECDRLLDRARTIYDELGLRLPAAGLDQVAGEAHILLGDLETAEAEFRRALLLTGAARRAAAHTTADFAHVLALTGRLTEAREFVYRSREMAAADDVAIQVAWRRVLSRIELQSGDRPAARALADEALALALGTDSPNLQADVLVVLAAAAPDDRPLHLAQARRLYEAKGNVAAAASVAASELRA